ncbi:palmitoyltransferase ZDHHC3-like [Varroa jacobsoni]|uniref:Palmitoyltransferase n=1 Tax=Varroa destructor TaxID=109461 RepID=A0A7M7JU37_VARDE|nr:palmitoyltransferase ZDHHC3-like [Varroa destructor]XP_022652485.1 palmitoyltransferase ZDHHC3-like [Varroa destructor]XP_022711642.1 palmitoyltransferase ZDHHC3-like [Varroa jacobsoni]XP_022711643.1 palmitoyltransferase ZDHHC3-like [Varroa jacobsoni]
MLRSVNMSKFDVCGVSCLVVIYGCVAYAEYALIYWMILPVLADSLWGAVHFVLFNTFLILALWAHGRASFGDPGVVPLPKTDIDFSTVLQNRYCNGDWTICIRCETFRPPHAYHCRICDRCIRGVDHHCPWINNCVGELNRKYFLQFLVYTVITCLYGTIVIGISWYFESPKADSSSLSEYRQSRLMHTVIFLVECLLFGLFVVAIFCGQLGGVMHGPQEGKLPAYVGDHSVHQQNNRRSKSCRGSMRDLCGRGPLWTWAIPCTAPPRSSCSSYEV